MPLVSNICLHPYAAVSPKYAVLGMLGLLTAAKPAYADSHTSGTCSEALEVEITLPPKKYMCPTTVQGAHKGRNEHGENYKVRAVLVLLRARAEPSLNPPAYQSLLAFGPGSAYLLSTSMMRHNWISK